MKVKISTLNGRALNFAVAQALFGDPISTGPFQWVFAGNRYIWRPLAWGKFPAIHENEFDAQGDLSDFGFVIARCEQKRQSEQVDDVVLPTASEESVSVGQGDAAMWKEASKNILTRFVRTLCWLHDSGSLHLDEKPQVQVCRAMLLLENETEALDIPAELASEIDTSERPHPMKV
ncbi:hypothetical protein [Thalassospira xiamenensis]|uniref:Uncharacterized protein n=1 Tax=Thalassospira xiamenensis TaxID=220697 RepID=A0A285TYK6_9PROT|nr:hypothetical protein [Thalassospira xiamenensis]SOC30929.1 hypothetical protein SAMN05428964_11118 [Thalassospira xiamenensis]